MTSSNRKGTAREREIASYLDGDGYEVIRAPASGSATERDLPDVFFGDGQQFFAAEVKSASGGKIYIGGDEIDALRRFAAAFDATPVVLVKYDLENGDPAYGTDRPGFYGFLPDDLYQTDGGNYRVTERAVHEDGVPETDLRALGGKS